MKRLIAAILPCILATAAAADAAAQRPDYQPMPDDCTYETCSLRIQAPTLRTPRMLVRGVDNVPLVPLGMLEPAIAPFLQLSDSAVAQAGVYDLLSDRGSFITLGGTVLSIAAPILLRGTMQKIGFTAAGIGLTVFGGVLTNRADDNLSRAVWWYNRELAARAPPEPRPR